MAGFEAEQFQQVRGYSTKLLYVEVARSSLQLSHSLRSKEYLFSSTIFRLAISERLETTQAIDSELQHVTDLDLCILQIYLSLRLLCHCNIECVNFQIVHRTIAAVSESRENIFSSQETVTALNCNYVSFFDARLFLSIE